MIGLTQHIDAIIKQELSKKNLLPNVGYSAGLFQMTVLPDQVTPEKLCQTLIDETIDSKYLIQLPALKRFELLTLAYALQKEIGQCPAFMNLNQAFYEVAHHYFQTGKYSFLNGGANILHYFTLLSCEQGNQYTESLIEAIAPSLWRDLDCLSSTGETLDDKAVYSDYTIANGSTGWLIVLLNAYKTVQHSKRIPGIVSLLLDYLKVQIEQLSSSITMVDSTTGQYSFFPQKVRPEDETFLMTNSMNWSEGDLNHVLLLYKAAEVLGISRYQEVADQIGMYTLTRRDKGHTLIEHSDLQHGAFGLVCVYGALQERNKKYESGYKFWQEEALNLLSKDITEDVYAQEPLGLLNGLVGIRLMLQSAGAANAESTWKHMMLLT